MNIKSYRKCCSLMLALSLTGCAETSTAADVSIPKIQNYERSDLNLMVTPFGLDSPVNVGKVLPDGSIDFEWPVVDVENFPASQVFMTPIKKAVGMRFCNEKEISKNDTAAKAVEATSIALYKYGKRVGELFAATQKELEDNTGPNRRTGLVLGSSITWLYSDSDAEFKAKCVTNMESPGNYSFKQVTTYDLELKKGWNIVQHSLVEKEDWKSQDARGSLPKVMTRTTVAAIPDAINWYMKYWANDKLLDLENNLLSQTPIDDKAFEDWLPSKLGDLQRTSYAIGEELEDLANKNNVTTVFSGGKRKIDITIADSGGSKAAVGVFLMTMDMTGSEWKEDIEDGYRSSEKMDGTPVLVEFNSKTQHSKITFNANDRLIVKADAENTDPATLWKYLQRLQLDLLN